MKSFRVFLVAAVGVLCFGARTTLARKLVDCRATDFVFGIPRWVSALVYMSQRYTQVLFLFVACISRDTTTTPVPLGFGFHPKNRCGGGISKDNEEVSNPGATKDDNGNDDYERAEQAIFDVEQQAAHLLYEAEQAIEHAVQDEVNTFFPVTTTTRNTDDDGDEKRDVKQEENRHQNDRKVMHDKKSKDVKMATTNSNDDDDKNNNNSVFAHDLYEQIGKPVFEGKKIGAEMLFKAEKAFEHAVEDEVHTLFPDATATAHEDNKKEGWNCNANEY